MFREIHNGLNTVAELQVPWKKSFWPFSKTRISTYKLLIGVLPPTPGVIKLVHKTNQQRPITRLRMSEEIYQSSASDAGNNDDIDHPYSLHPTQGWHVVPGTAKFIVRWHTGVWNHSFVSDAGNLVQYKVTTIHKNIGTSGQVRFSISFTETQNQAIQSQEVENIYLRWGNSKAFNFPAGSWLILFDAFDGSHTEINGADHNNPFLKVDATSGGWVIRTADPRTLAWPP